MPTLPPESPLPLPPKLFPERRAVLEVPPYRIFTREWGSGSEAVLLLHGLSGSSRWWLRNVQALAGEFRVIVPDLIGFGRTRAVGAMPGPAQIAELLRDALRGMGLATTHLVGHSMGGLIATHLAAHAPDRIGRLVLVDPAGVPFRIEPRELVRFTQEAIAPAAWGDLRFVPTIVRDAIRAGPRSIAGALIQLLRDDVRPVLASVSVPTLIVWGEHDSIFPVRLAESFRSAIPDARVVVIPNAAHNPMIDQPEVFNRVVIGFLRGRVESGG